MHLHSANSSQSYIPQQILDQKALELKKRKEISDQINVSLSFSVRCTSANVQPSCRQSLTSWEFDSSSDRTGNCFDPNCSCKPVCCQVFKGKVP